MFYIDWFFIKIFFYLVKTVVLTDKALQELIEEQNLKLA